MSVAVSSFCGSRSMAFRAAAGCRRQQQVTRGVTGATMRKQGIHPEWFPEAKVFCNGVEVMTVGGTKESYNVDIYSGNHPFYSGNGNIIVVDEGQLNKFKKRFAGLEELSQVSASASGGPASKEDVKKAAAGRKGAGKAAGGKARR
ncbi:50S ribosomal protein chloroplastic [Raphidocelis subcapitata]|uniref:50S ribosomal protein L31 n=1 Tax=Raphidocelis subcapitata TaxID=307507 RepID=A0A2V0PC21_9CHLO|nr:50S ribosomal protein chloroplastic [Raphidocelis subcapitata]|eukprot:GBF96482.1 50S ribosomal protein chloroplastic [Raphidocelis subcapitata]